MAKSLGTAYTLTQYNEVLVALIRALPKVLEGTDPKEMIKKLSGSGEDLEVRLRIALLVDSHVEISNPTPPVSASTLPAVDEVFEMTLENTIDPMEMVRSYGYTPKDWKYEGTGVQGATTRRFKHVQVGYCANWNEVIVRVSAEGKIPEGQWMEAYKAKYPYPDGNGPVGIADSSWVNPRGDRSFPYVRGNGEAWGPYFSWTGNDFHDNWRWLVEVSD